MKNGPQARKNRITIKPGASGIRVATSSICLIHPGLFCLVFLLLGLGLFFMICLFFCSVGFFVVVQRSSDFLITSWFGAHLLGPGFHFFFSSGVCLRVRVVQCFPLVIFLAGREKIQPAASICPHPCFLVICLPLERSEQPQEILGKHNFSSIALQDDNSKAFRLSRTLIRTRVE